jgi:hypothetical protein
MEGVRLSFGAVAMGAKEPSLGDLTAFVREQFGLDPDLDRVAMARLAAIGLTVQAWRNTSLEDLHAGDHVTGGFPDSDMMRFNIATFRVVSEQVGPDRCEWNALEAMLTDPGRVLPGGVTVGALAGSEFEQLASDVRTALSICRLIEQRRGFPFLLMLLALQAGTSNKEWYGSPWWPDIVSVFIELIDDPASSFVPGCTKGHERRHQRAWGRAKRAKTEPFVKRRRTVIDCVNDHCADRDLLGCADHAHERVAEKGCTDPVALLADIDS